MDMTIEGVCLSWKCRECSYGVATTAQKLCYWDNKKFSRECYLQITKYPYAEK